MQYCVAYPRTPLSLSLSLSACFLQATNVSRASSDVSISLTSLFAKYVRLPSVASQPPHPLGGSPLMAWHTMQDLSVVLRASESPPPFSGSAASMTEPLQWWALHQTANDTSPFGAKEGEGLQLIIVADRIAGGTAGSAFFAGGVIAFYSVVVLGISRLLRSVLGGSRYHLVTDEMPHTRDVFDLCEAVAIARREGSLLREAQLYETILRLYRSPETLLRLTGAGLKRE